MGVYDQSARFATVAEPDFVVARLAALIGWPLCFRRMLNTRSLPLPGGPNRDADLVAIGDRDAAELRPVLLIFEFQSSHDPEKLAVLHLEAMIFLCYCLDTDREGGRFFPLPAFVYLREECPERTLDFRTPTGTGFLGEPAIWELARDSAEATLAQVIMGEVTWGAMFWIALMQGGEEDAVIDLWHHLLTRVVPERSRTDVAYVALIFAELAGCRLAWERRLGGITMTESAVANEMIELGDMRRTRFALIRVIRLRFPQILTTDLERAIADQPSLPLLLEWLDAAFDSGNAETFLDVVRR